jgi:hypothetical protein
LEIDMLGRSLKDAGIKLVLDHSSEWQEQADLAFDWWIQSVAPEKFTIDDFRDFCEEIELPQPHHPNAWGAFGRRIQKRLHPVGFIESKRPSAHARIIRMYERA